MVPVAQTINADYNTVGLAISGSSGAKALVVSGGSGTSLSNGVTVGGGATVGGALTAQGDVQISGNLNCDGRTTLDSTVIDADLGAVGLQVNGASSTLKALVVQGGAGTTLNNGVAMEGGVAISGTATIGGGALVAQSVQVNGDLNVDGLTRLDSTTIQADADAIGLSIYGSNRARALWVQGGTGTVLSEGLVVVGGATVNGRLDAVDGLGVQDGASILGEHSGAQIAMGQAAAELCACWLCCAARARG